MEIVGAVAAVGVLADGAPAIVVSGFAGINAGAFEAASSGARPSTSAAQPLKRTKRFGASFSVKTTPKFDGRALTPPAYSGNPRR